MPHYDPRNPTTTLRRIPIRPPPSRLPARALLALSFG